jgi:hypothetical protein
MEKFAGNDFIGWIFVGFSFSSTLGIGVTPNLVNGILWCILAKACFIHADIKRTTAKQEEK